MTFPSASLAQIALARSHACSTSRPPSRPQLRLGSRVSSRRRGRSALASLSPEPIIDALAAVDAWSVTSASSPSIGIALPPGIETKLFQIGLLPYLAYLWFLNAARATPPTSNVGARFLLLFVAATIPAGILAKTHYGDILANVDVLHGSSESLLTISNALFAYGFGSAAAASDDGARSTDDDKSVAATTPASLVLCALFLACASGSVAIEAAVDGGILGDVAGEPANALSLPTWAVHVSSVTEWALAMKYVARHGERSGNEAWKNLTVAMSPFLASGLTACTFHAFYNSQSINALVPMQALLTLIGNCGCAYAAYTIKSSEAQGRQDGGRAALALEGEREIDDGLGFALKLALWTTLASAAIKYGELYSPAADFFAEPTYDKAIGIIALPSVIWSYYALNSGASAPKLSMADVKAFGVAGTASYVVVELAFWALALPIAIGWYKIAEGTWLDLSNASDKAKLLGAGAVFINVVRLFVPLRLAAALALAPVVSKLLARDGGDASRLDDSNDRGEAS